MPNPTGLLQQSDLVFLSKATEKIPQGFSTRTLLLDFY
jgi:hypothetical protein